MKRRGFSWEDTVLGQVSSKEKSSQSMDTMFRIQQSHPLE